MSVAEFAPEQSESLLRIIESGMEVRRRYQFFLWTQADVQRLLPHKLLVCGAYDRVRKDLGLEALYSVPLPTELIDLLVGRQNPFLRVLLTQWGQRQQPLQVILKQYENEHAAARQLLALGYQRLLIHAVARPGRVHELESCFLLGSPDIQPTDQHMQILALLMPYIHSTYLRVQTIERAMDSSHAATSLNSSTKHNLVASPQPARTVLTERECEILRWVREGKSNHVIGEALMISPLTVKNHVQKILRKLGAANRAQAVAKAMTLNLLMSHSGEADSNDA